MKFHNRTDINFSRYIGINKNQCLDIVSRENPIKPKRRAIIHYSQAGKSINFASSKGCLIVIWCKVSGSKG